ncbi:MAG: TIGR02444 family protein [Rhodospirillales bacterium]
MDVWTFVVTVYRNPGVEAACLHLQDRRGADVTALFFLLWAGTVCGRRYAPAEAEAVAALAAPWQAEVVGALRGVRRRLKAGPAPAPSEATGAFRARLAALEQDAERLILEQLAAASGLVPSGDPRPEDGRHNLHVLLRPADPADEAAVDALVTAAAA